MSAFAIIPSQAPTQRRDLELERLVRQTANNRNLWEPLVRFTEPRLRLSLESSPEVELRLLTWSPGQGTGFHDHGGSAGCFMVVRGSLIETIVEDDGGFTHHRRSLGHIDSFTRDIVHDMRNCSRSGAVSIHAYRPVLSGITHYRVEDGVLKPES